MFSIALVLSRFQPVFPLLSQGLDLWLVDWGQPNRTERWLTIDDYVDDYIHAAVERICRETGHDRITLLGICEGGVFTTCYAALHPKTVKSMVLTITPIDFHADAEQDRLGHGFINIWTRSLDLEDIDRLIEAYGNLPGEFMGSVHVPVDALPRDRVAPWADS